MEYRAFGRTGWQVSAVSFGAWAIGSAWGEVDDRESLRALHKAVDLGVSRAQAGSAYCCRI
jgi:aryl-alcohol dehydrogenase-like predicted oxidoreductase